MWMSTYLFTTLIATFKLFINGIDMDVHLFTFLIEMDVRLFIIAIDMDVCQCLFSIVIWTSNPPLYILYI